MSEQISENKWLIMVASMSIAWMSWMTLALIGIRSQVDVMMIQQQNIISPVVESSFKELRERMNSEAQLAAKLSEAVLSNTKDISYLKGAK